LELSQKLAHPLWLVERWARHLGLERARQICIYDQHPPAAAIRFSGPDIEAELKRDGIELAPGQLLASARRVRIGSVSRTRAFAEGRVAVQDEASQLVALLVGKGSRILDCCGSLGERLAYWQSGIPRPAFLLWNCIAHRARLLRKLVPAGNVEVINADVLDVRARRLSIGCWPMFPARNRHTGAQS
jgi:16S rRNA (cytosine967-C5)-methyltransferase